VDISYLLTRHFISKRNTARRRSGKRSNRRSQRRDNGNETRGDVPKPVRYSQNTISCTPPTESNMFTARILTVTTAGIVASATVAVTPTYTFSLSDIDNTSAFTGLFDQYRIDAVRFIIRPNNNAIGLVTNSTTAIEPMYCVIDYDNNLALTSAGQARSYDNCMIIAPGESACRTFTPRLAMAAYQASSFIGFTNEKRQWLDSASPAILHYGIKIYVPAGATGQTQLQSWIVEREYFLSFRKISSGS